MRVEATAKCFVGHVLREPGDQFNILDEPTRALTEDDDKVTRSIAVKNKVPCAFESGHMIPLDLPGQTNGGKAPKGKAEKQPPEPVENDEL